MGAERLSQGLQLARFLRLRPGPAHLRLLRTTALGIGVAGLVFGVLALAPFSAQHPNGADVWAMISLVVLLGLPIAIGAIGSWAPMPVLPILAAVEGLALLIVLILWPLAHDHPAIDAAAMAWPLTISAVPVVCMALVARGILVWGYLSAVGGLTVLVMLVSLDGPDALLVAIQTGVYAASFSAVLTGLVLVILRGGERLDRLQAAERVSIARSAARVARESERARFDRLIHDGVISTLLIAGRADVLGADHAGQAARTLAQLDSMGAGERVAAPVDAGQLLAGLRQLAAPDGIAVEVLAVRAPADELDPSSGFSAGDRQLMLPEPVLEALLAASGEAVRNSLSHAAGPDAAPRTVERRITVTLDAGRATVAIWDNGVGFDPVAVRPERMGVSRSIRERMADVPGGSAELRSQPGRGTEVVLEWRR